MTVNRKRYPLLLLLLILFTAVIVNLCGCSGTQSTSTTPTPSSTASLGAQIYATNCAVCHGTNRQGTGQGVALPTNDKVIAGDTDAELATFITVHRIALIFTQDQLTALVSFLKTGS